jgi:hypothetical protein
MCLEWRANVEERERQKLIEEVAHVVTEQLYRSLPEIVANLAQTAQSIGQRFIEFYEKYPEFKEHTEIVGHEVQRVEGKDPLKSYDEILETAVPRIRKAIEAKSTVDMNPPKSFQADRKFIEKVGNI